MKLTKAVNTPRIIAFYLPQFHPIPENDAWWGKGFTEWTNVTKAKPLYDGHYQPHLPADLGFYDLRLGETRRAQIQLAKSYGIDAFCYHYYWFSGKRLLERPLNDMLSDPESDMPFCLCWANETWSRRWNGKEEDILIAQEYQPEDDEGFIRDLLPYLKDSRYLKVAGKPFIIVYRPTKMPDPLRSTAVWRDYCRKEGLGEIHLCAAFTFGNESYAEMGFDSGVEFPPHPLMIKIPDNDLVRFYAPFRGKLFDYSRIAAGFLQMNYGEKRVFKTVFPSWDNSARTGERAVIMHNAVPANFEYWLARTIDQANLHLLGEHLVFINAWNEWAEGCHLEPDREHGLQFLEAVQRVKQGERRFLEFPVKGIYLFKEERAFSFRVFMNEWVGLWKKHAGFLFRRIALVFIRSERWRDSWLTLATWFRTVRWMLVKPIKRLIGRR